MSVALLQQEFLEKIEEEEKGGNQENLEDSKNGIMNRAAVLSIAYHNMGVELEYLKRFDEAIRTYKKAVMFAKE